MNTPIKLLTEVFEAAKERPDLYDGTKIPDRTLVAAVVQLSQDLEDFKKSMPSTSGYQEDIPEKSLTLTSLQQQLYLSLVGTSLDEQHERALKIYKLLKSL
jgi:hypothetical protein